MAGSLRSWGLVVIQAWSDKGDDDDDADHGLGDRGRGPMAVGAEPCPGYPGGPETAPERMVTGPPPPELHIYLHGVPLARAVEEIAAIREAGYRAFDTYRREPMTVCCHCGRPIALSPATHLWWATDGSEPDCPHEPRDPDQVEYETRMAAAKRWESRKPKREAP
jgi:hypothetical protein